jgi:hypothetical protein
MRMVPAGDRVVALFQLDAYATQAEALEAIGS